MRDPWFLLALASVPLLYWWATRRRRTARMAFPSSKAAENLPQSWAVRMRNAPLLMRCTALALLCLGLARPQKGLEEARITTEGIDIILAIDVSGSMLAEDFQLAGRRANRLAAAKTVVEEFIKSRPYDRIGMVVFAARAYTQCPLTIEHGLLLDFLGRLQVGMIEDGTAIGSAIATASKRLEDSKAKSKIIVLLTDGRNNAGAIDPLTAARAAKALGIKIYTVGAGTKGMAPYPVRDAFGRTVYRPMPVDIDDATLRKVAEISDGRYFRATDTKSLEEVYREIDRMEKTEEQGPRYAAYVELFPPLAWAAFVLVVAELVISRTRLRRIP